jgi:hypothetical protein
LSCYIIHNSTGNNITIPGNITTTLSILLLTILENIPITISLTQKGEQV